MRMTGTNVLGPQASANILLDRKSKVGPIDYKINQCLNFAKIVKNRFGDITIADMCDTTASAQFDGACERYQVPDTRAHFYKPRGQVNTKLNAPKSTFLSEIYDKEKKQKRPAPTDYKFDKAFDYSTQKTTKRY